MQSNLKREHLGRFPLLILRNTKQNTIRNDHHSPPFSRKAGISYPTIFKYLYTVGLLNPHTLASSLTFIVPVINAGYVRTKNRADLSALQNPSISNPGARFHPLTFQPPG